MFKKQLLTFLSLLMLAIGMKPAVADTILEQVARTGTLTVGTSFDLVPYAYVNPEGELVGYSIDIVNLIKEELQKELGKPIQVNFVESNSIRDTIPKMFSGEVDMACNAVFTWERDEYVDFTVRYGISGIRLLTPTGKLKNTDTSLAGKRIGIQPLTFVKGAVQLAHPQAILVEMDSVEAATNALKEGKIDALAGDVVILDGIRQQLNPNGYEFYPPITENPYARYGVACIVPDNNSTFLYIANRSIVKMMEGYVIKVPEYVQMIERWIGENGVISVVKPEDLTDFFQSIIVNHEQIPFSDSK